MFLRTVLTKGPEVETGEEHVASAPAGPPSGQPSGRLQMKLQFLLNP